MGATRLVRHVLVAQLSLAAILSSSPLLAQEAERPLTSEAEERLERLQAMFDDLGFVHGEEALRWALSGEHQGPFHMVNLLKFRERALYPEGGDDPGGSGLDAQRRYGEAMAPLIAELGVRSLVRNRVEATAIFLGEDADWDMVTVVYYPSPEVLIRMVEDPRYHAAAIHKHAALERTQAFVTLPGGPVIEPPSSKEN